MANLTIITRIKLNDDIVNSLRQDSKEVSFVLLCLFYILLSISMLGFCTTSHLRVCVREEGNG